MTEPTFLSFAEQSKHYFARPHQGLPGRVVDHPAAWMGEALRDQPSSWSYDLSEAQIDELYAAVQRFCEAGLTLGELDQFNFQLPELAQVIDAWCRQIVDGTGFVVVRSLPVAQWSEEEIRIAYWGIGHHLGRPGGQNPQEELLGHVTDYGETQDDPFVRLYRTSANINFHCDIADVVGLLCLQPAKQGGQSRIVSTITLFNALSQLRPDLAPHLFEPFLSDRRDKLPRGVAPVGHVTPCCFDGERLRTFYHSEYFRSVERHEGVRISEPHREILDMYDQLAGDECYHIDMQLGQGDMQFLSNHYIAHARTAYEDEPDQKRHLLRLWLSVAGEY